MVCWKGSPFASIASFNVHKIPKNPCRICLALPRNCVAFAFWLDVSGACKLTVFGLCFIFSLPLEKGDSKSLQKGDPQEHLSGFSPRLVRGVEAGLGVHRWATWVLQGPIQKSAQNESTAIWAYGHGSKARTPSEHPNPH